MFTRPAALVLLAALALPLTLCACKGTQQQLTPPPAAWVAAERATIDAVAPEFRAYVESDPNLTPDQVQLRLGLLTDWEARVRLHEYWLDGFTDPTTDPTGGGS